MRQGLKGLAVLLLLVAAAFATALLGGVGCPVKSLIGIPCPGCGMSRAAVALLRLAPAAAFRYHPMVFLLPPVVLLVLFGKKPLLGTKVRERVLLWSVLGLWGAIWLVRLLAHDPVIWL